MYGPQASFFSELFGARVRYTGASLGYQFASVIAGGLSPMIAATLLSVFHGSYWPIAVYMIALAAGDAHRCLARDRNRGARQRAFFFSDH